MSFIFYIFVLWLTITVISSIIFKVIFVMLKGFNRYHRNNTRFKNILE